MGFNTINFTSPGNGVEAGTLANGLAWDPTDLYRRQLQPRPAGDSGRSGAERAERHRSQRRPSAAHQPVEHLGAARSDQRPGRWKSRTSATAASGSTRTTWSTTTRWTRPAAGARHRHHQSRGPHAAHVVDHVVGRGGARLHEALREFPRHRHGDSEPAALPAVQRHRLHVGAARQDLVRRLPGEGHQALLARPAIHRRPTRSRRTSTISKAPATSSTAAASRASHPAACRTF